MVFEKLKNIVPVTAVIPCFRCVRTLDRAVASVAGQTILPQELILVDDCSGDETRSLMTQLQSRYKAGWIKLVLLDANVGAASARNAGWDQARGDFVAFLDADDAWHPRKIELQYGFMISAPEVVISGHGHLQVGDLQKIEKIDFAAFETVPPLYILLKNPFVTPSFMVRRNLNIRFLSGRRHMEDHYFLMQISAAGLPTAKANVPLTFLFKAIYGDAGLSADLLSMQRSELENYSLLGRSRDISTVAVILFKGYSWLKFCRRYVTVWVRSRLKG
jgi:teichuronic acid biosynthesis glycosyltransferase TuaG